MNLSVRKEQKHKTIEDGGLVSVVVACYNEEPENIRKTLSSIINQNYQYVEIIIVDGKSNEDTIKCLNEFQENISVFLSEPDKGIYDAMNKGVVRSSGEWVIFMNVGDGFYSSNTLSILLADIDSKCDVLYGDIYREDVKRISKSPKYINRFIFYSTYFCHQSLVFRRQLFTKVGLFDLSYKFLADRDWILKAYVADAKFQYKPVIVCGYEGGGVSTNLKAVNHELMEMRKKSFSKIERVFYFSINIVVKIHKRLLIGNFNMPVAVKKFFTA
jgi:glycosyltransferase involved in cell wall biosynthesis